MPPKQGNKIRRRRGRPRGSMNRMRKKKTPLALQPHNFVERGIEHDTLTPNTEASATILAKSFTLNDIYQSDSYRDLFEFYRIDKIVVTFRMKGGNATNATHASSFGAYNETNPLLYFKVDHNDADSDSLSLMKESTRTKEHQFSNNKPNFTITLKPAIQTEYYKTALTTAYAPKWGQWLRTADSNVPHYGLKAYAIGYSDANQNQGTLDVSYKYYISFKNNE